jgi:hypothetical protein
MIDLMFSTPKFIWVFHATRKVINFYVNRAILGWAQTQEKIT